MFGLACLLVLAVQLVTISGKLEQHVDKHHQDQQYSSAGNSSPANEERKASHDQDDIFGAKMYKTLFKVKHREHFNAVRGLMAMDHKKREKLLSELFLNIVKVMNRAKNVIDKANFKPNDAFPTEEKSELRDAIANIVENTAFYSSLILHFPTSLLDKYQKDMDWQLLFAWAYNFTVKARLHNDAAEKLLDLAGQQLEIIPRRDNFYNPYDRKAIRERMEEEAVQKMEEALRKKEEEKKLERKKKKTKKPSLSKTEM